ncbi:hypothetical protein QNI19_10400 [Cytophagaceae bacterium DM2B3-1]|uniref:Uncharacterized protein n=1 Tax=Xanthocytophaga flava TaxID=3048013 RepID=A0ABT7CK25_9BACT|nr:hypothetical protein [Xanthocytophaga flavus]MDJ1493340.1 hypothetical protein [Xanthocytophaga flavus]
MKFIYFTGASQKAKVLEEGIFLRPNHRKINEESTGIFCYPLLRIPFKAPVIKEDYDDINDYLAFKKEEQVLNESLTIEESWSVVDAPRVRKHDRRAKKVIGVIFELEPKHWPITVFIDIQHFWANEFAQILLDKPNEGIVYGSIFYGRHKKSLLEVIKGIESERYVLCNAPFIVNTEENLLDFINKFQLTAGGIWKHDSFECMLTENVSSTSIKQIIKLENK